MARVIYNFSNVSIARAFYSSIRTYDGFVTPSLWTGRSQNVTPTQNFFSKWWPYCWSIFFRKLSITDFNGEFAKHAKVTLSENMFFHDILVENRQFWTPIIFRKTIQKKRSPGLVTRDTFNCFLLILLDWIKNIQKHIILYNLSILLPFVIRDYSYFRGQIISKRVLESRDVLTYI